MAGTTAFLDGFSAGVNGLVERIKPEKKKKGSPNKKLAEVLIDPLEKEGKSIENRQNSIARTLRSLRAERKKLTQRKKAVNQKRKNWEGERNKITIEVKDVKEKLPVKVMRVLKEKQPSPHAIIMIETLLLYTKIGTRKRKIGKYLIRIDPFARKIDDKIRISNIWKRVFNEEEEQESKDWYDHPYISNSRLCLGNTGEDFENLFREREIFGLVELAIDFLRINKGGNPHIPWDEWFKQIRPLPKKVILFPNRDYSLISEESEPSVYKSELLNAMELHVSSAAMFTDNTFSEITTIETIEWPEYMMDKHGRVERRSRRRAISSAIDSDKAEIDALRDRIMQLSKELVDLKRPTGPTGMSLEQEAYRTQLGQMSRPGSYTTSYSTSINNNTGF